MLSTFTNPCCVVKTMLGTDSHRHIKWATEFLIHRGRQCEAGRSDRDEQTISGSLVKWSNIRSCRLPNQIGLCVPAGTFPGIVLSLSRVQLPCSVCQSCWRCGGVEEKGGQLSRSSAHAWMRFWGRCCHQPVDTLPLLVSEELFSMIKIQNKGLLAFHTRDDRRQLLSSPI